MHDVTDQCRCGSEAFEALFREHYRAILGYTLRRTDAETAGDVAAETFVVAWRRLGSIPRAAPRAWLFGVARRTLANAHRQGRRQFELEKRLALNFQTLEDPSAIPTFSDSPTLDALRQLSARDREVIQFVAWEGLDNAELAIALGVSKGAARVRLSRAKQRLRKKIAETQSQSASRTLEFIKESGE